MARSISMQEHQRLQRGGGDLDAPLADEDVAEMDPLTGRLVEKVARASSVVADADTIATRLRALDVRRECDETTALGLVRDLVRQAAEAADVPADHDALSAEAERIWTSFGSGRTVHDVNPDGTVAGVRAAEMTPDRGEGVGTTVHAVPDWRDVVRDRATVDDGQAEASEEPRFSGAGAADDDLPFTEASRLIPSDGAFLNNPYRDAPELANLAATLIERHGFFHDLRHCLIDYAWARKGSNSKGKRSIGKLRRVSGSWRRYCHFQFVIELSADTARLAGFTDLQVEAALFHQLAHISTDDKGNWIRVGHDFEGFASEITHFGPWTADLKIGATAFTTAVQLGLDLDDDAEDDEDDEDDGHEEAIAVAGTPEDVYGGYERPFDADDDAEEDDLDDDEIDAQRPFGVDDGAGLADLPDDAEIDASLAARGG